MDRQSLVKKMENNKYQFWIPVAISVIALIFSGVSLWQSNASFNLSRKTAKPYLNIKLKKFSDKEGYYTLKRNKDGIVVSFQLELENTGSVPITDVSISKFNLHEPNKKINHVLESSTVRNIIYPTKSRLFVESFTMTRIDMSAEKAWSLAQKEGFDFDLEFIVEYSNVFDRAIKTRSEMTYKFNKTFAGITKNQLIE
jgi:hypothetical protein